MSIVKEMVVRDQIEDPQHRNEMIDYLYQIGLRKGTTEYAINVTYDFQYNCLSPVGGPDHLGDVNFPIDVSYIYGEKEKDWVRDLEEDFAKGLVEARFKAKQSSKSQFHICPTSNHNLHFTNSVGLSHIILNDILGSDLPVLPTSDYKYSSPDSEYKDSSST